MTSSESTLTLACRDLLLANLPAAIPAGTPVRASGDTDPAERPEFVFSTTGAQNIHPRLVRLTLILTLTARADETAAATAAAWHQAACEAIAARILTLRSTLALSGLNLLRFIPADLSDAPAEDRHRTISQAWTVHISV